MTRVKARLIIKLEQGPSTLLVLRHFHVTYASSSDLRPICEPEMRDVKVRNQVLSVDVRHITHHPKRPRATVSTMSVGTSPDTREWCSSVAICHAVVTSLLVRKNPVTIGDGCDYQNRG